MGQRQQPFLVKSVAEIETRLRARHGLRVLWWRTLNGYQLTPKEIAPLANTLGIATHWLTNELAQPHSFGLLFERVEQRQQQEGIWWQRWFPVKIEQAIWDLRVRLNYLRRQQKSRSCWKYNSPDTIRQAAGKA